jgi:hypothetical protein
MSAYRDRLAEALTIRMPWSSSMQLRSTLLLFALSAVSSGQACAQQGKAARQADSTRASLSSGSPVVSAA